MTDSALVDPFLRYGCRRSTTGSRSFTLYRCQQRELRRGRPSVNLKRLGGFQPEHDVCLGSCRHDGYQEEKERGTVGGRNHFVWRCSRRDVPGHEGGERNPYGYFVGVKVISVGGDDVEQRWHAGSNRAASNNGHFDAWQRSWRHRAWRD